MADFPTFLARIKDIYWETLAPERRQETRPDPPADEPVVPDDIWQAAVIVFPEPAGWLHNPIPAHKGRTPLELIRRGQADVVRDIIENVSGFFLADPNEVRPWDALIAQQAAASDAATDGEADPE